MANHTKYDEPPAYVGSPAPQAPQQAYYPDPHQQQYGSPAPGNPSGPYGPPQGAQGQYYQPGPQMGYYPPQQGGGYPQQGGYPPQQGGYYPQQGPPQGYYQQQERGSGGPGIMGACLGALACCCCLDMLF